jgi:hypothetical protein
MSKTNCSTIRRQLDEMKLDQPHGLEVSRHLNECSECREFDKKQTKLRQIVGSLATVTAPPDFDFRLRSRLARDNSNGSYLQHSVWLFGRRAAAVTAAVLMIVVAIFLVRALQNRNTTIQTAVDNKTPSSARATVASVPQEKQASSGPEGTAHVMDGKGKVSKRNLLPPRNNRFLVSEAAASSRAPVIRAPQETFEPVFPIDASQQSLRVSLFDGRGNPRTISLPTVTFGSQRVVPTTTSFAPKGVW